MAKPLLTAAIYNSKIGLQRVLSELRDFSSIDNAPEKKKEEFYYPLT